MWYCVSVYHGVIIQRELRHKKPLADFTEKVADFTLKDKKRQNREKHSDKVRVKLKYSHYDFSYLWCKHDKRSYNGLMSTFALFLRNVLTCVKPNSCLKLHFFVSTELGENTSEISTFVWLRAFFWRQAECCLTLHICLLHWGTSAVHLDNGKGYVSGFGEITFCEYYLKSNVGVLVGV